MRISTFWPRECSPGSWAGAARSTARTQHGDVVNHGVGAGVALSQSERQRFPGALGPLVDESPQRVEPEAALEHRRRGLLLRVRRDLLSRVGFSGGSELARRR